MLVDIFLLEAYNGVSAQQYTQVPSDVAEALVSSGIARKLEEPKQTKSETKKTGK